ncbi:glutathione S-transferase N-terminal domain-containing protein [Zavarzinia compransoris]|uniref:glutathione S-transferase N-terminal domain-containing protein n=1 Tax=Zavarzinia marina TaxID=2911065 RepID=UPI001F2F7E4F|nr:glutathione S-transferase N-terminal domain-containing protein [Zavarzinia marina]MCF4166741.1 glutathione S-transferase N-terminal domain-containing protein [Zavarzinia marina]
MSGMRLCWSPTSPYVRKVMIMALETGLADDIELLPKNVWAADTDIGETNPLGKVPALILAGGTVVFDSPVILEILDGMHGGTPLIPPPGPERTRVLTLQALADGLLDAAVLRLLEGRRPAGERSAAWDERQKRTLERGLDALEDMVFAFSDGLDVGQIAVLALLGYLDFRFAAEPWRAPRPALAAWFEEAAKRPAFVATIPKDPA